jgi:dGTPase
MGSILRNILAEDKMYSRLKQNPNEFKDTRSPFLRDQTAIIHSRSFQRLKNKTQLITLPDNDHICTRMEHSLYVGSIAGVICKNLGLDVELAQAIGYGHDIGHPPFGHRGEKILEKYFPKKKEIGFKHSLQGIRIVDCLEQYGDGLNLTYAVRNGILAHSGEDKQMYKLDPMDIPLSYPIEIPINLKSELPPSFDVNIVIDKPLTWEACVVKISDSIAFLGRDLEDAIHYNIIDKDWRSLVNELILSKGRKNEQLEYWQLNSKLIRYLVNNIIHTSIETQSISYSDKAFKVVTQLLNLEDEIVRKSKEIEKNQADIEKVLSTIIDFYLDIYRKYIKKERDYKRLKSLEIKPNDKNENTKEDLKYYFIRYYLNLWKIYKNENMEEKIVLDYVSGMTDREAKKTYDILTDAFRK